VTCDRCSTREEIDSPLVYCQDCDEFLCVGCAKKCEKKGHEVLD